MKRLIAFAALVALVACFALVGCAAGSGSSSASDSASADASAAESSAAASDSAEASPEPAAVSGGWTIPDSLGADDLTDDQKDIFMKAIGAQAGMDYEPIAVLATQVVAGQNLAYLCRDTLTTDEPVVEWDIVVVYNDVQGDASITSVTPIDLSDIKTTDEIADSEAVGAWEVQSATSGAAMTPEAAEAFSKAAENHDGVEINPLALLGTQVVAGTNYLILGTGNPVVQNPVTSIYVATVYEDLEGNCEFSDVSQFDLLAYIG